uniref:Retrovirus-related Pol polyprotein from transposon TNT 1-94 n=1 Tax=Cajanus cajan TaxID=3821 RepID=A0A151U8D2_CAJCA|nr:hypothetical protein KK1_019750 [Cajanus cajan]
MSSTMYDIRKFTSKNDFIQWRMKMRAISVHQWLEEVPQGEKKITTIVTY